MSPTWCDFTFPGGKSIVYFIHRLYSDYLYFASSNKSADDFHEKVTEALQLFENCMLDYSLRACVYNNTLNNAMPVRIHQARLIQSGATRMLFCAGEGAHCVNRVLAQRWGTEHLNVQMIPSCLGAVANVGADTPGWRAARAAGSFQPVVCVLPCLSPRHLASCIPSLY